MLNTVSLYAKTLFEQYPEINFIRVNCIEISGVIWCITLNNYVTTRTEVASTGFHYSLYYTDTTAAFAGTMYYIEQNCNLSKRFLEYGNYQDLTNVLYTETGTSTVYLHCDMFI